MNPLPEPQFPPDLFTQIKNYIKEKGSLYDEKKVFFYIDCTTKPTKLVIDKWLYDFSPPKFPL